MEHERYDSSYVYDLIVVADDYPASEFARL